MRVLAILLAAALACTATASAQLRMGPRMQPLEPAQELAQFRLLEQAFASLAPQRPGVVDAYVLSVALWDEHVFQNEAEGAASVLSQRFNAQGRTIVLSNGKGAGAPRTHGGARPGEVAAALARIGEVMDREEDVLVLFMTSHGQQDGALSVQDQQRAYAIYPSVLRRSLDQVGVKNRLVIVSACFAGAFIPALQNDTTMVFTAAAHDRTSFGCAPENDWTYFGDAFVNQTLRQNRSLDDAFSMAKTLIQSWEARENIR
ncbi:MAG: C13 family peptidase, partial [Hyphomonadaceae bacterium]|nr:C13 family peptidase [Hyphomonadaceae bacterium]